MFQILSSNAIIVLPSPGLNDTRNALNTVQLERAMDGTVVTSVKKVIGELRTFNFLLSRRKSIEYYRFMQLYIGEKLTIIWGSQQLVGYTQNNPVELTIARRAVVCQSVEEVEVNLNFQIVQ